MVLSNIKKMTWCNYLGTADLPIFKKMKLSRNAVKEDENIDVNVSDEPNEGPSHSEAYSCLTDGLK
ncbi:hypothetical protein T4D_6001 [Trichinella pseudospiralis]|uniref:Uncharacterized protein n=1 Tax=Trichinella pseudospiralis TaxID=6337 RepID=A0A0V1FPG0_TRIPS|nr:hypothetical protein T4D_6001 [Trichinella pseudospiralis]